MLKPNSKILILTGTYHEYLAWRKRWTQANGCKFIESLEDIEGHIGFGVQVILYGNYKSNPLFNTSQFQSLLAESKSRLSKYIGSAKEGREISGLKAETT
jgi:hypothetical protein